MRRWAEFYFGTISGARRGVGPGLARAALLVLSEFFRFGSWFRGGLYHFGLLPVRAVGKRVISVGNLVAGGTGKTPLTIMLAKQFAARGLKPGIVARGYGGRRASGTGIVSDGKRVRLTPREAGDEAYLLVKELPGVPVVVDTNKTRGAAALQATFAPEVILVDDGFQHLKLARRVDIVLLDARRPFGYDHLLPRGLLREPPEALRRAQVVVVTRAGAAADLAGLQAAIGKLAPEARCFTADLVVKGLRNFRTGETLPASHLIGKRLVLLSGIAQPESFEEMVRSYNPAFTISYRFPDHHHFTRAEMLVLRRLCDENRMQGVVTTAKDAVKLSDVLDVQVPVFVLLVEFELREPGFIETVLKLAGA